MPRREKTSMALKIMMVLSGLAGALGAIWWAAFALKPCALWPEQLTARYAHASAATPTPLVQLGPMARVTVGAMAAWAQALRFPSFGGTWVPGRIVYPADPSQPDATLSARPVVLALHGMGRTQWRWWQAEFKGRPTIENTHLLAEREPYERLIVDPVKDYRVLLDWIVQQPHLDADHLRAAGYSMGAQMALLLAGVDTRVRSVAAVVPPHLDATVAAVAPASVAARLAGVEVWLLTADNDDYASRSDNTGLFAALIAARSGTAKKHLIFPGGHLLPPGYVDQLQPWLAQRPQTRDSLSGLRCRCFGPACWRRASIAWPCWRLSANWPGSPHRVPVWTCPG